MYRRSFLLAIPQAALAAACAFGSARVPTSTRTDATSLGDAESNPQPPDAPATHEREAAPQRVQPLPLEDDRAWLQEWLDLITITDRKNGSGC